MTIQTRGFTFDSITSDELGLMVCEFNGNTSSETSGHLLLSEIDGTKVEMQTIQKRLSLNFKL